MEVVNPHLLQNERREMGLRQQEKMAGPQFEQKLEPETRGRSR